MPSLEEPIEVVVDRQVWSYDGRVLEIFVSSNGQGGLRFHVSQINEITTGSPDGKGEVEIKVNGPSMFWGTASAEQWIEAQPFISTVQGDLTP